MIYMQFITGKSRLNLLQCGCKSCWKTIIRGSYKQITAYSRRGLLRIHFYLNSVINGFDTEIKSKIIKCTNDGKPDEAESVLKHNIRIQNDFDKLQK